MSFVRNFLCLLSAVAFVGCASERSSEFPRVPLTVTNAQSSGLSAPGAASVSPDSPDAPIAPPPSSSALGESPSLGAPAAGEVTIQPECVIQIRVEEDPSLDGNYTVNQIGAIQFGYVGPVILFNRTESQAEQKIREVLSQRDFRKATVRVRIMRASYDQVQVGGEVNKPSIIQIGSGDSISLNDVLLRAGGIRTASKTAVAQVIRGAMLSPVPFALEKEEYPLMDDKGRPDIPHVLLRNNDMLFVAPNKAAAAAAAATATASTPGSGDIEIIVLGEVNRAGVYRFSAGEPSTMMHLMFKLGKLPAYANKKSVRLSRRDADGLEHELKVNVEKLMDDGNPEDDIQLQNGDRIKVPARRISLF
jgi:protein involved in polysaccharide export with SLBB domain